MLHLLVYATTSSRLHADLAVVRLHEAGIATSQISIFHPQQAKPNSALWLNGSAEFSLSDGETVLVSGFLNAWLRRRQEPDDAAPLTERLSALGFGRSQSLNIEECLLEHRVIVAVAAWDELKLPAILRCLQGVGAEDIRQATVDERGAGRAAALRREHPAFSPIGHALAAGGMA